METQLNLVVLRVTDIDQSASQYQSLGLSFQKHQHGNGPCHYASESSGVVFELYPATEKFPITSGTRVGFRVDRLDTKFSAIEKAGWDISQTLQDSPWGRRAVLIDRDGHKVEVSSS